MRPAKEIKTHKCPISGKLIHRTIQGAVIHAIRLEHSRAAKGQHKGVYLCSCGAYHVGGERKLPSNSLASKA